METAKVKSLNLVAHVGDAFRLAIVDENENVIANYDGEVPCFFPDNHYGDHLMLNIDVETGLILNWQKPTSVQLEQLVDNGD